MKILSSFKLSLLLLSISLYCPVASLATETEEPPFQRHAIAAPAGQAGWAGVWAVSDQESKNGILIKLWAGAGSENRKTLLWVDAATGRTDELIPPGGSRGLGSHSTYLSRKQRFYDVVADLSGPTNFYEFDVASKQWISHLKIDLEGVYRFAHSFTEDDDGAIYAGILGPGGALLRFSPEEKKIENLGRLVPDDWLVYPHLMSDSAGWVYAATAHKEAYVVAYSKATGITPAQRLKEKEGVVRGIKTFRGSNGRAYFGFDGDSDLWFEAYEGKVTHLKAPPTEKEVLTNRGARPWNRFPDGAEISTIYVSSRTATLRETDGSERKVTFDYPSTGIQIYSLCAGDDGKVYGSTGIPLRFFAYDPATNQSTHHGLADYSGHTNDVIALDGKVYGAIYGHGSLIEYDPSKPWDDAHVSPTGNPRGLYRQPIGTDFISRPLVIAGRSGGKSIYVGGIPHRVSAGGGLLIYDRAAGKSQMIPPRELVPDHGVKSLALLKEPLLAVGSTAEAATGGVPSEAPAQVFLYNTEEGKVVERIHFPKGTYEILDLISTDGEQVIGVGSGKEPSSAFLFTFQVTNPSKVERIDLGQYGTPIRPQAARILSQGPDGGIYLLFRNGILRYDHEQAKVQQVATSPVPISVGSAWVGGRLYFGSLANIWSWRPPSAAVKASEASVAKGGGS